jgi:hypothetical protein
MRLDLVYAIRVPGTVRAHSQSQLVQPHLREGLRIVDELHRCEARLAVLSLLLRVCLADGLHLALELVLLLFLARVHALRREGRDGRYVRV